MRIRSFLIGLAAAFCAAAVQAGNESTRRLAAELAIMAGDARQLASGNGGPLERAGLIERLQGALASLPLLLRRAGTDAQPITELRTRLDRGDWRTFGATLDPLVRRHPFDARFLSVPATPQRIAAGNALHKEICAPCHDAAWGDTKLPAKPLAAQMAGMPRAEFAARLWLGVRGTRDTGYANPFSDEELAALITWYGRTR